MSVNERRLPRACDAGHDCEDAEGDVDTDVSKVVGPSVFETEGAGGFPRFTVRHVMAGPQSSTRWGVGGTQLSEAALER